MSFFCHFWGLVVWSSLTKIIIFSAGSALLATSFLGSGVEFFVAKYHASFEEAGVRVSEEASTFLFLLDGDVLYWC